MVGLRPQTIWVNYYNTTTDKGLRSWGEGVKISLVH